MCNRYYFAAYSGGECILRCQGTNMKVKTPDITLWDTKDKIFVDYIDDDGNPQQVILSANAVWTLERGA